MFGLNTTPQPMSRSLRVLAALLGYPDGQLRSHLTEMSELLRDAEAAEDALEELTEGTGQPAVKATRGGGMVDVYRKLQPTATDEAYTWWSNRGQAYAKNVGWRLDYHLATPALAAHARSEAIYKGEKFSDHAPITIDYDWAL